MFSDVLVLQDQAGLWLNLGATALVILLGGSVLGRISRNLINAALKKLEVDRITTGYEFSIREFISSFVEFLFDVGAFCWAMSIAGLLIPLMYLLMYGAGILVAVAILLWLRDACLNLVHWKRFKMIGKAVRFNDVTGVLRKNRSLWLTVETKQGIIEIPYVWLRANMKDSR